MSVLAEIRLMNKDRSKDGDRKCLHKFQGGVSEIIYAEWCCQSLEKGIEKPKNLTDVVKC